ncbi:alpha/beta fold hydrolase [uncultured Sphingomonas sp.]|uniref:alpha/beta fold hydrolase n=1 Tax=uncultured Sphingomonas sp. TaxID=158754 RepID=UPI00260E3E3B|nr:alpha/beta fold hydrolase [uncultured Sphingomonas sp.]
MNITRHFLDVASRRVHYRKAGSGPPLLMVHQSPRSSAEYEGLMREWGAHFTCIAPDTPGFGQSDPLAGAPDIGDFAEAIIAFLDAAGLGKVAAYGFHSGGIILVSALRRHPERFAALAVGGYAVWTEAEQALFDQAYLPPFRPSAYGEHLAWLWNRLLEQSWFFPWFDVRPPARLPLAHADPVRVDAAARELLDSGDAYRAGYGAVLRAPRDIPDADAQTPPVLITAYDGDPLQAHLARLGALPARWEARAVATMGDHRAASLAFLRGHPARASAAPGQMLDEGFVRVTGGGFDGLIHWRGDRAARRILLHAPGGSTELLDAAGVLLIDLPGHGLSDDFHGAGDLAAWEAAVAAAVTAISTASARSIVGEGVSALLALAVARRVGAATVEAFDAHIPFARDGAAWLASQPDPAPDRFGGHLTRAWGMARASRLFWPWFRADAAHAIPFEPGDLAPERLALAHRSLIRGRAAGPLLAALLGADRAALVAAAPPITNWQCADWANDHPEIWTPQAGEN